MPARFQMDHLHGVEHVQEVLSIRQMRRGRDRGSASHVLVDGSSNGSYLVIKRR